jgi:hypothetical protein
MVYSKLRVVFTQHVSPLRSLLETLNRFREAVRQRLFPNYRPFAVGKITVHWTDESRIDHFPIMNRELMVASGTQQNDRTGFLLAIWTPQRTKGDWRRWLQKFFRRPRNTQAKCKPMLLRLHNMLTPQSGPC